jgi:hypothetical protein
MNVRAALGMIGEVTVEVIHRLADVNQNQIDAQ